MYRQDVRCRVAATRQSGAAIAETIIALPILLIVILGAIQFGLIYEAKATLNNAALQGAREGAVHNADVEAIRRGIAKGLVPLYSPDSSLAAALAKVATIESDLAVSARIRILNPTREAFDDFAQDVDGKKELPNDRLASRSTELGARSGLNIQDANLLRVQVMYGYRMDVPLVNWFLARTLLAVKGLDKSAADPFERSLLMRNELPIITTITVRMQTPAHLNDAMVSKKDLPALDRIPVDSVPPGEGKHDPDHQNDGGDGSTASTGGDSGGSSLGDSFFGFGEGGGTGQQDPGDTSGGEGGGSGSGSGNGGGGGSGDSGDPVTCDGGTGEAKAANALPALGVGNPIHVVTGNKYQQETDLEALPGTLGLLFVRHYNSDSVNASSVLGAGWRHSFQASLEVLDAKTLSLRQADGRRLRFKRSDASDSYLSGRAADGHVTRLPSGEFEWTLVDGRTIGFSETGRLIHVRERGEAISLDYDAAGDLHRARDLHGRVLELRYFPNGRIARVRGPAGFEVFYDYDSRGNLARAANANGVARVYRYEDDRHPHHLTSISVMNLKPAAFGESDVRLIASWKYDAQGRGIESTHPEDSGKVSLAYGKGYTDVTDAFGRLTRYRYDQAHGVARVSAVEGPGCGSCGQSDASYEYNERQQLMAVRTRQAGERSYQYDSEGRLIETSRSVADGSRQWVVRYEYEGASDRPSKIIEPSVQATAMHVRSFKYDDDGEIVEATERGYAPTSAGSFEAIERTLRYTYDAGLLKSVDGARADVADVTRFEYDARRQLRRVEYPDGSAVTVSAYDDAGRPLDLTTRAGLELELSYDIAGRLARVTEAGVDKARTVGYSYDAYGDLAAMTLPDGRTMKVRRDAAGRITQTSDSASPTAERSLFAADGQPEERRTMARGGAVLRTLYFSYDAERRLQEVRDGSGPPVRQLEYAGSRSQMPRRITDPLGAATTIDYDALNQVERIVAPDGGITAFSRDAQSRVIDIADPVGATTHVAYDDFGRRVREENADRGTTHYRYDAADHLIEKVDARGARVSYAYDAAGNLREMRRDNDVTRYHHDRGQLVRVEGDWGEEYYEHDQRGRVTALVRKIDGHEFTTRYRYDEYGRVAWKRLPGGQTLSFRYRPDGQVHFIAENHWYGQRILIGVPADSGSLRHHYGVSYSLAFGNGLTTETQIDPESGAVKSRVTDGVGDWSYQRDDIGRIRFIKVKDSAERLDYDATGQLRSAVSKDHSEQIEYDLDGNRIASRVGATSTQLHFAAGTHRLIQAGARPYHYDAAGNPTDIGSRHYDYDSSGRAIAWYEDGVLKARHRYNAAGERISKTLFVDGNASTTYFIYEDHRLVAEADSRGRIQRQYLYLEQHPVVILDHGNAFFVHTDHLGTPVAVTDKERRVVWTATYESFGQAHIADDPDRDGNRFTLNLRFPGQYADAESGTYYNLMRDYDPSLGRYLTPDPSGITDGTNPYAYVHNNPVNSFDSLGLYDEMVHYYMTYFLALVAGLPQDVARTMAVADQYVDENYQTQPIHNGVLKNDEALPLYHFTLDYGNGNFGDNNQSVTARFFSPQSQQLHNLFAGTNAQQLQILWAKAHPMEDGSCALAPESSLNNARYQLFGEYLHAYEDTYAHRDALNMPYGVNTNSANTPVADWGGHAGPDVGDGFGHAPDHTYNQNYKAPSSCRVPAGRGYATVEGLSEEDCSARNGRDFVPAVDDDSPQCQVQYLLGGTETLSGLTPDQCAAKQSEAGVFRTIYHAASGDIWAYNELRTLRMEFDTLNQIKNNFAHEINVNVANGAKSYSWADVAGRATWDDANPENNSRIGSEESFQAWASDEGFLKSGSDPRYNAALVLQEFNASTATEDERLDILNSWLAGKNLPAIPKAKGALATASDDREKNIGWIPAGSFTGVLLPSDRPCTGRGCVRD